MRAKTTIKILAAILLAGAITPAASAGTLLEIRTGDGPDDRIEGESVAPDHVGWIDVISTGFGTSIGVNSSATRHGVPGIKPVVLVKELDKSSPKLQESVSTGEIYPKADIKLPLDGAHPGMMVTLYKVSVLSYSVVGNPNDIPHEHITLGYEKIEWTYRPDPDTGNAVARSSFDALFGTDDPERDDDGDGTFNARDDDDDNDGIDDAYELQNGLHPLFADADYDDDGDGKSNFEEWLAGTYADDSNSRFGIYSVALDRKGNVTLKVPTIAGRHYKLRGSFDLASGNWMDLDEFETGPNDESGLMELVLPPATAAQFDRLFFSAEVSMPQP